MGVIVSLRPTKLCTLHNDSGQVKPRWRNTKQHEPTNAGQKPNHVGITHAAQSLNRTSACAAPQATHRAAEGREPVHTSKYTTVQAKEKQMEEEGNARTDLLQRTWASSSEDWSWQTPRHRAGTGPMPSSLKLPASGHPPA